MRDAVAPPPPPPAMNMHLDQSLTCVDDILRSNVETPWIPAQQPPRIDYYIIILSWTQQDSTLDDDIGPHGRGGLGNMCSHIIK